MNSERHRGKIAECILDGGHITKNFSSEDKRAAVGVILVTEI